MSTHRYLVLFFAALFAIPSVALAHATPVDMDPHSGAMLQQAPTSISIRFSERLEPGSSLIRVEDEQGTRVDTAAATVGEGGASLSTPVRLGEGIYKVTWSVVSKDDGHFTRGSYAFSVGSRPAPASSDEEVVQIASTKEATLMFIEFIGNSLLWGLLALFLLIQDPRLRRPFSVVALAAVCAAIIGAVGQVWLKSSELAGLHEVGFFEALKLYLHTVAGYSTLIRMIALSVAGTLAAIFGFRHRKSTVFMIGVPLLVFAYFRAIVSHATANPFYPALSMSVNFVHVIEKDLWFGMLAVLCVILSLRARDAIASALVPRVFSLLSANLAILAVSAAYIVWLHLKSFSNLTGSNWGSAFMPLLTCAIALIALQTIAVALLRFRPLPAKKYIVTLVGAETAAALLVVFFSSVVIITAPPPHDSMRVFVHTDTETVITLSRSPYEDDMAMLAVTGPHETPIVSIGSGEDALQVALAKRANDVYVFPVSLVGSSTVPLHVIVARPNAYDAQAVFEMSAADLRHSGGHGRSFDMFTIVMIAIAVSGVGFAWLLRRCSTEEITVELKHAGARIIISGFVACAVLFVLSSEMTRILDNPFKSKCIDDGNMWHMMQPTKAGVPVSGEAREGCMWGMGTKAYQFSDKREYDYLSTLGPADVAMETVPARPVTGIPTTLTFRLSNQDGTPATLLIDMEKYVHVVIVSKDESVFAHIHPDDIRPLTQDAIDTSIYSVEYVFPRAGEYLVSLDYAHGTQLESRQFKVDVSGAPTQSDAVATYKSPGVFDGYTVAMDVSSAYAGEVSTLKFTVQKDGVPVTTMQPYLSAVSHLSVVKNDLSTFIHTHGEIHPPGQPYPPIIVRNGKIIHSMSAMMSPSSFGPTFEAHVLFPTAGRYTVWAQIKIKEKVIPTSFTVDVD